VKKPDYLGWETTGMTGNPVAAPRGARLSSRRRRAEDDMTPDAPDSPAAGRTDDIPVSFDERTTLITMLDYARDTVHAKCAGLADADARRSFLPGSPLTTISGLVSHLRWVEADWIEVRLLGGADHGPWTDEDPDREMRIALEIPLSQLLAEYRASCARHSELVADLGLDTRSRGSLGFRDEPVTLRWILLHLIEETARHNGHLDILRELADGTTGR
jgi:uncharacterized damage-inducible protein DinB